MDSATPHLYGKVTFLASEHHSPSASTKLYCLVTEAGVHERLSQGRTRQRSGWDSIRRPLDHLVRRSNYRAKAYNTCIAPQAAYPSCSGAVHVTDRADVQPMRRRLSLRPQTDLWPTSHTQPWSSVQWSSPP